MCQSLLAFIKELDFDNPLNNNSNTFSDHKSLKENDTTKCHEKVLTSEQNVRIIANTRKND